MGRPLHGHRDLYQLLGAYTVLDPKGNQMHVTYASSGTAEYYRRTGKFPDGAVLVKEVFGTEHAQLTTGDSHWASGTKAWFVKIKDDKHRFPQSALWQCGHGPVIPDNIKNERFTPVIAMNADHSGSN